MIYRLIGCLLVLLWVGSSCKTRDANQKSATKSQNGQNSVFWVQKLKYVTNGYKAPSLTDFFDPKEHVDRNAEELVLEFMQSPRFAATLMSLHLFYVDAMTDQVKNLGLDRILRTVTSGPLADYPQAQSATYELMKGKDYLKTLWAWEQKILPAPSTIERFYSDYATMKLRTTEALTPSGFFKRFRDRTTVTNFHRARAAHILKTFFCDDLSLDKAVLEDIIKGLADNHDKNQNAHVNGSCVSCHFRLDPIGSFFRYYNADGSYWDESNLVMSNGRIDDSQKYLKEWEDKKGNVIAGYALTSSELVSHGDHLENLFEVIADPKVKRTRECLVKKTAQFFTSQKQIFDVEWIRDLATEFDKNPADSSAAMRNILVKIFTSNTFKQESPEFDICYDEKDRRPDAPPCSLRYLTNEYCVECHKGNNDDLNLASWVPDSKGRMTFKNNLNLDQAQTMELLLNAIQGKNGVQKMPMDKEIPLDHKQAFINQLQDIRNQTKE